EREVEPAEERLVIVAGPVAERWAHGVLERRQLRTSEHADTGDPESQEPVKFALQAGAIAVRSVGAEVGGVPHVRANVEVSLALQPQRRSMAAHEMRLARRSTNGNRGSGEHR